MANKASATGKWGQFKTLHYYAQTILDLEDIAATLNHLVEQNIPQLERSKVKSRCMVTGIPVKGRTSGFVLRVDVPEQVIEGLKSGSRSVPEDVELDVNQHSEEVSQDTEDKSVV